MVKDNDGKAARRAHIRQISVTVGLCSFIVFVYEIILKIRPKRTFNLRQQLSDSHNRNIQIDAVSQDIQLIRILSAEVHLVDLSFSRRGLGDDENTYSGVSGVFCKLEWSKHKANPSSYPMLRDLLNASPDCRVPIVYNLMDIVRLAKIHDENTDNHVHVMPPKGFVFHESRCGSTLAANVLAVTHPESTRVYSESAPPIAALQSCGKHMIGPKSLCSIEQAALLFRHVVYMMGRTNNSEESNLFFKIQSVGTKNIDVFQKAFPTTPWIFVYRDPVHVLMSQLQDGPQMANCIHQLSDVPMDKLEYIESLGRDVKLLTPEEKCALHLSLLCESALQGLEASQSMGISVSYDHIVENLMDRVLPDHFGVAVDDAMSERITEVGKHYSKGRGMDKGKHFRDDSKAKDDKASDEVKASAQIFLRQSYMALESYGKLSIE